MLINIFEKDKELRTVKKDVMAGNTDEISLSTQKIIIALILKFLYKFELSVFNNKIKETCTT